MFVFGYVEGGVLGATKTIIIYSSFMYWPWKGREALQQDNEEAYNERNSVGCCCCWGDGPCGLLDGELPACLPAWISGNTSNWKFITEINYLAQP